MFVAVQLESHEFLTLGRKDLILHTPTWTVLGRY
jgi:hypothetical protein